MPAAVAATVVGSIVAAEVTAAVMLPLIAGPIIQAAVGFVAGSAIRDVLSGGSNDSSSATAFVASGGTSDGPVSEPAAVSAAAADPIVTARSRMVNIRQAVAAWEVVYGEVRKGGVLTYIEVSGDKQYLHLVLTVAGHVCQELGTVYLNEQEVPLDGNGDATGTYAGHVRIKKSLGAESGQPFPDLVAESAGLWTDAHRQSGRAKLYIRLKHNNDLFPNGIPVITMIVKGRLMFDSRSPGAADAYSNNGALCVNDYLTNLAFGIGATYASEVYSTQLSASANSCDEAVSLAAGGSEVRYRINGSFKLDAEPKRILELMLAAIAGKAVNIGGLWYIFAGVYDTPTLTYDEDDLAGGISVQSLVNRRDTCNGVKGVFTNPNAEWQPTDFPALASSAYMAQDSNERIWRDMDLSAFVTSGTQAQRIAKIELLKTRQGLTVTATFKLNAWEAMTGRTIQLTNTQFGWSGKAFEVVESKFVVSPDQTLNVELTLRETASAIFDWSTSEEQDIAAAANSNLPNPFSVNAPGTPSMVEELYETRHGRGAAVKAVITWAAPVGPVREYQVAWKPASDTDFKLAPIQTGTTLELLDVEPGLYDVKVLGINSIGVRSAYSSTLRFEVIGLTAAPAVPTIRGLQTVGGLAILTLDAHPDLDVRRGGRWMVRHNEATDADDALWDESFSIGESQGYVGDQTIMVLPLKPGTYLVRAQDSTGHQSADVAKIETKQSTILQYTTTDTIQEDTAFTGLHEGTIAIDSMLKMNGAGLFDDIPSLDAISSLDAYGGIVASGTYYFVSGFDFGGVQRRRLTSKIEGITVNENDLIDDRTEDMDDWLDFDGTSGAGSSVDAWVEFRQTDDAGSPSDFSVWKRLDSAEVVARRVNLRLRMVSMDPAYNLHISRLRVVADAI